MKFWDDNSRIISFVYPHSCYMALLCDFDLMFLLKGTGQLSWYSEWLRAGQPWFNSLHVQEVFFLNTASRLVLGLTESPNQCVPRAPPTVKRLGRDFWSHAFVQSRGQEWYNYIYTLHTSSWRKAELMKYRDNLTFYFLFYIRMQTLRSLIHFHSFPLH